MKADRAALTEGFLSVKDRSFLFFLAVFKGAIRKGIRQIPDPRDSRP